MNQSSSTLLRSQSSSTLLLVRLRQQLEAATLSKFAQHPPEIQQSPAVQEYLEAQVPLPNSEPVA